MKKISRLVLCTVLAVILVGGVPVYAADGATDIILTINNGSDYTIVIPAEKDEETTSPQTGDDSNVSLWGALLLASGGAILTTAVGRRKKAPGK